MPKMIPKISHYLRQILSQRQYNQVKRLLLGFLSIPFGNNLNKLAQIYKSDKFGHHNYTEHYSKHFQKLRFKRLRIFEIGAGGYHFPDIGGNSLRMWKRYFPFAKIYSLDIYDKSQFEESRIKIFQGNQTDLLLLENLCKEIGEFDIIIDDGSHINEHVIMTFKFLFPKLKEGGTYIIEDTQTSYWPDYGGDSENLNNPNTILSFFKDFADCLNHQERINPDYFPTYFDLNIISLHFYHNLIFVCKGVNDEPSSFDPNNPDSILRDKIFK